MGQVTQPTGRLCSYYVYAWSRPERKRQLRKMPRAPNGLPVSQSTALDQVRGKLEPLTVRWLPRKISSKTALELSANNSNCFGYDFSRNTRPFSSMVLGSKKGSQHWGLSHTKSQTEQQIVTGLKQHTCHLQHPVTIPPTACTYSH